ncbi:MAG: hypothetical protein ACFFDQ_03450 [Candidatus Thorarchaeota archaeon]
MTSTPTSALEVSQCRPTLIGTQTPPIPNKLKRVITVVAILARLRMAPSKLCV